MSSRVGFGRKVVAQELGTHRCIGLRTTPGKLREWAFKVDGAAAVLAPHCMLSFNDAELVLRAALEGQGLAQLKVRTFIDYVSSQIKQLNLQTRASR